MMCHNIQCRFIGFVAGIVLELQHYRIFERQIYKSLRLMTHSSSQLRQQKKELRHVLQ